MRAVFIDCGIAGAVMLPTFKTLVHAADIECGRPEAVVLAADQQQMTAYILNGDHNLIGQLLDLLRNSHPHENRLRLLPANRHR